MAQPLPNAAIATAHAATVSELENAETATDLGWIVSALVRPSNELTALHVVNVNERGIVRIPTIPLNRRS